MSVNASPRPLAVNRERPAIRNPQASQPKADGVMVWRCTTSSSLISVLTGPVPTPWRRAGDLQAGQITRCPAARVDDAVALDQALIDVLADYGAPQIVAPGWAVRIDVHFLGGRRHYYSWEVADIGVLVLAKHKAAVEAKKIALLQSKRLYPDTGPVSMKRTPRPVATRNRLLSAISGQSHA